MNLFTTDPDTPTFNGVLTEKPITEPTPQAPTKRQKAEAAKLTSRVWDSLNKKEASA